MTHLETPLLAITSLPSLEHALTVAVIGLSAGVVALWGRVVKEFAECKRDREALRSLILERHPQSCIVKNCPDRTMPPTPTLEAAKRKGKGR